MTARGRCCRARSARRILKGFADALWENREKLVDISVAQGGCTVTQAQGMQVLLPIQMMYGYAELAKRDPIEMTHIAGGAFEGNVPGRRAPTPNLD
jgi:acyl-CoA reductase-like NAD-dependent aldehyde dehydrogenase